MEIYCPHRASAEVMTKSHSDDYIKFLHSIHPDDVSECSKQVQVLVRSVRYLMACLSYQSSVDGSVESTVKLNIQRTDITVSWAGGQNHAKKSDASGFCFVNDIVLAILELLKYRQRVLYVDIDILSGKKTIRRQNPELPSLLRSSVKRS